MRLQGLAISSVVTVLGLACAGDEQAGAGQGGSSASSEPDTGPTPTETPTGGEPPPVGSTTGTTGVDGGSTADTGTGELPGCGDGIVGPGEQCDAGFAANTVDGACLPNCVAASCGDGFVEDGVEQCDLGAGNSHEFGGCVPGTCFWGPRCGDGVVTPGHEICDPGAPVDPEDGETLACGSDCRYGGRLVFLSSASWDGAELGGVAGADLKCQTLAKAFDPDRFFSYRAWLSDGIGEPAQTFEHGPMSADTPYVLRSGVVVAASFDDLVQSGPKVGITITDTLQSVVDERVWTHTTYAGHSIPDDHHCTQWTSDDLNQAAMVGRNAVPDGSPALQSWIDERWWTRYLEYSCSKAYRLYCFED